MNKTFVALVIAVLTVAAIVVSGIYWTAFRLACWGVRQILGGRQ
jgi:hypothetical protein